MNIGEVAPDFVSTDQNGKRFQLSAFKGKQVVVLFFYPADETPGCTREVCAFRDSYEVFVGAGAEVVGVSGDSPESHTAFASNHGLPFRLLSDSDGKLRELYKVEKTLWVLPGRVTFVIDKAGVIRHLYNSQIFAAHHAREAAEAVRQLQGKSGD